MGPASPVPVGPSWVDTVTELLLSASSELATDRRTRAVVCYSSNRMSVDEHDPVAWKANPFVFALTGRPFSSKRWSQWFKTIRRFVAVP